MESIAETSFETTEPNSDSEMEVDSTDSEVWDYELSSDNELVI